MFSVPRLVFSLPVVFPFPRFFFFFFFFFRGVSGSQVLVFSVPGLVFSLPSSCVGVFGSQVWVFSVPGTLEGSLLSVCAHISDILQVYFLVTLAFCWKCRGRGWTNSIQ